MLRSRCFPALVPAASNRSRAESLTVSPTGLFAAVAFLALVTLVTSTAEAQGRAADETPLHVAASRFEFLASGDPQPPGKPLVVHNGGATRLSDVRLTRLVYADSARGSSWLVVLPGQSTVAPNELATIGTLCIDAAELPAGTYRATAAVSAREVAEPVAIAITLVVTHAGALARHAAERHEAARCGTGVTK